MLSLQEIQSKSFEKAVFGGYDMRSVDEFLEKIAEDYSVFQKENATLKAKMKVLIEKIEEYRTVEESMRKALLSAQNIADEMVTKAKLESELLISNAKKSAKDQITKIANEIKAEEQRLEEARDKTQTFAMKITEFYQNEIDGILRLSSALDLSETSKTREQEIKDFKLEVDFKENEKNDLMSDTIDTSKKIELKPEIASEDIDILGRSRSEGLNMKVIEIEVPSENKQRQKAELYEKRRLEFNTSELKFGSDYMTDEDNI